MNAKLPPAIHFPGLNIHVDNQQKLIDKFNLKTDRPIIGLMPGAEYGPAKQWPVDHFNELAGYLSEANMNVWVFGSPKEAPLGEAIASTNNNVTNLCGLTTLTDVVDLLALTQSCVTNDSGLMHVACATGRPVIAIYGSSDPDYTPPLSAQATIVYKNLQCSPCFKRHCPYGHTDCLHKISAKDIYNLLANN